MAEAQIEIASNGQTAKVHQISLPHWQNKGWSVVEQKLDETDEKAVDAPEDGEVTPASVSAPADASGLSESKSDKTAQGESTQS